MKIDNYNIQTCLGSLTVFKDPLPFLSHKELNDFNTLGYTGKYKGKRISVKDYLNSLGKGQFEVNQTKFDNGDFIEEFTITRVTS